MSNSSSGRQAKVTSHFDAYAAHDRWGDLYNPANPLSHSFIVRRRKTVELLGDLEGETVLDVGCGTGALVELLASKNVSYQGVDIASKMVEVARQRISEAGLSGRFEVRQADVTALPFPDGHFGAVVGMGLLEYFDDPRPVIREARRVAKPGGRLVFTIPRKWSVDAVLVAALAPVRALARAVTGKAREITHGCHSDSEFASMFTALGCALESDRYYNHLILPYPVSRLVPRAAQRAARWAEDRRSLRIFATGYIAAFRS